MSASVWIRFHFSWIRFGLLKVSSSMQASNLLGISGGNRPDVCCGKRARSCIRLNFMLGIDNPPGWRLDVQDTFWSLNRAVFSNVVVWNKESAGIPGRPFKNGGFPFGVKFAADGVAVIRFHFMVFLIRPIAWGIHRALYIQPSGQSQCLLTFSALAWTWQVRLAFNVARHWTTKAVFF